MSINVRFLATFVAAVVLAGCGGMKHELTSAINEGLRGKGSVCYSPTVKRTTGWPLVAQRPMTLVDRWTTDGFRVGTTAVDEILEWTEPGSALGITITEVKFTWHLIDVPSWAKRSAFNGIQGMAKPVSASMVLQKTNKGWREG